ncbi:ABC transporter permease [Litorimonas sp. WD9-15]|uniref:ABC transporter permease n=1 Tax=Litorimonas sp. WD9-15 TaxID=3418716 RepID=UPI003D057CDE
MSFLPIVDLRRTFLIARRDYLGYVKTWGFWLSFVTPILFGVIGFFAGNSDFDISPPRYETIIDETGQHEAGILARLDARYEARERAAILAAATILPEDFRTELETTYDTRGKDAALDLLNDRSPGLASGLKPVERDLIFVDAPANTIEDLTPWLSETKTLMIDGKEQPLSGAVSIKTGETGEPVIAYWTTKFTNTQAENLVNGYFKDLAENDYLASGGLEAKALDTARKSAPEVETFDPTKSGDTEGSGQQVTMTDKIPFLAAGALAGLLWLNIFAGSYMLLTSMLEEKLNKLLEMMLASTRFAEIIFGKLIGVAALTLTAMAPYLIMGVVGVLYFIFFGPDKEIAEGLIAAFSAKMIIFLIIFFILGYVLYGAFFIALGALSSSMQDAQTLTTPIMLVMMAALIVVPIGLNNPDSPLITIASFIPFSAPFAAIISLPSDPPLWQLLLSTAWLALWCVIVISVASRIFRFGLLSGAGLEVVTNWFKRTVLRRKA